MAIGSRIEYALALATLALFTGSLGTLAPATQRLLGFSATALMVVVAYRCFAGGWYALVTLPVALGVALSSDDPGLWVLASAGVVAALAADTEDRDRGALRSIGTGMLIFGVALLAAYHVPLLWRFSVDLSVAASSGLTRDALTLGPSASGLWMLFGYLCIATGVLLGSASRSDVGLSAVAIAAGLVTYVCYLVVVAPYWPLWVAPVLNVLDPPQTLASGNRNAAWVSFHSGIVLYPMLLLPGLLLLPRAGVRSVRRLAGPAAVAAVMLAIAAATVLSAPATQLPADGSRVLLYNQGMLDWRVPRHGMYGLQKAGMFGLFPRYLSAAGYEPVRMRGQERISPALLEGTDVFVVINPTEPFSPAERDAVWQYVAEGGGLLVLGDHTDLGGMMEPLNDLLAPVNISFRFDSAFSLRRWVGDVELFPHQVTRRLDWSNERLQQSTGASLELGTGARPLVNGRYAFSDAGVAENEANGYLGDYRYQYSEQLGDVVVVAGAEYGRGRVAVFGDTSAFQNTAIFHSAPFVVDVMDYLSEGPAAGSVLDSPWLSLVLLGTLAVAAVVASHPGVILAGCLGFGLSAVVVEAWKSPDFRFRHPRLVFVEADHLNRMTLGSWERHSVGGLANNMFRSDYLPLVMRGAERPHMEQAVMTVSIAPGRAYESHERKRVLDYVRSGGTLVLSAGWEERHGIQALLEDLGLGLDPRPLGPVPVLRKTSDQALIRQMQSNPQFQEAWGIVGESPLDEVLYEAFGMPIVGLRRLGDGQVVVIGDSYFLLDRALEEENAWWPGNVRFLRNLLVDPAIRQR